MSKELSQFTIGELLDALFMIRTFPGDPEDHKAKMKAGREKIIAELETRPAKDLVQALLSTAG